jgi:DNA modification methylase
VIDLRLGDALSVLRSMPDGSVGHIVTDPPYGQTNEAYDSPVAFDPALWRECYRVAREGAALVAFAGSPTYHRIASAVEAGGWKIKPMWGWVYRNGFITSAYPTEGFDRLAPAFDPIVVATKGKVLLNVEREPGPLWKRNRNEGERCSWSARSGTSAGSAAGRWPRSLVAEPGIEEFTYFALNPNSPSLRGEKVGHPNQKPLALMRWIVAKLPKPGPIHDPFAGSGTTLVAAEAEGFDATGSEQSPEYHALGLARIAAEQARHPLLDPVA